MPDEVSFQDKISPSDLPVIAQQLYDEYMRRKDARKDLEKHWKDIDRQLRMEPETSHKRGPQGQVIKELEWLPEIELPLQAQTLETLVADIKRFRFPKGKDWYRAHVALTEDYLEAYASVDAPFVGETGADRGPLTQDDANRIAQAVPSYFHRQYPFQTYAALCDVNALKYGFGVGRMRRVNKMILGHHVKGRPKKKKIPMLIPRSPKCVFLDDTQANVMHEGETMGPNTIQTMERKLADVKAAAMEDDTYIKSQVKRLVPDKNDCVTLIELEGDLVYETSQSTIVVRDVVLTGAVGKQGDNAQFGLIREQKGEGYCTYVVFDYHQEFETDAYATAPLIKGRPIQGLMSRVMNQLVASGELKIQPPTGYDSDDPTFAADGGPVVAPRASWGTTGEVKVYDEVGGDPATFWSIFAGLNGFYNDVTGGHPARLGAETKSHTTAFAKDAELSQGAVRTVNYSDKAMLDPMTRVLEIEYMMGRENWSKEVVYVEAWDGFLELEKKHLPEILLFEAIGAGAPADDVAKQQQQQAALQTAMQVDAAAIQFGFRQTPRVNYDEIIDHMLEKGGIQDISRFVSEESEGQVADGAQLPAVLSAVPGE